MWPLLIEVADPQIEIGLQLVERTIHLFAERDTIDFIEHGLVEALTDAVGLRALTFKNDLEIMDKVWNGEPVNGGTLSTWPGCKGGPPILIGAWRSPRWITYAAKEAQGWTPSGRYSSLEDLEFGMKTYREAGGTNAVLANCSVDLQERPESAELAKLQRSISSARRTRRASASSGSRKWASRKS